MKKKILPHVRNMLNKKIVLLGPTENVRLFYHQYKDRLDICGWIDLSIPVSAEEWSSIYRLESVDLSMEPIMVRPMTIDELASNIDQYTAILCQRGVGDNQYEALLAWYGLEYLRHYVLSCIAEAVISEKKVVILHGFYCFIRDLLLLMETNSDIVSKYIFFIYPYDDTALVKYRRTLNIMMGLCDFYVFNKDATGTLRYNDEEIPPYVKKISFPCLNFGGLYPQIDYRHYKYTNPFHVKVKGRSDLGFKFGDNVLNKAILEGKSDAEILEYVNGEGAFSTKQIKERFSRELRCAELYEYDCDVKIVPYIKMYYREFRIMNCNDHWAEMLLMAVGEQILTYMGFNTALLGNEFRSFKNPHIYSEVPIYPVVGEALQMDWVNKDTKYTVRMAHGNVPMTFDEYVQRYCAYVRAVIELYKNET